MKTLATTLLALAAISSSLLACSSSDTGGTPAVVTETGTGGDSTADVVVVDTAKDTATGDTKPIGDGSLLCDQTLAKDFACKAPTKAAGGTACTEAMLQDYVDKCVKADFTVPATCADWRTANAACNTCLGNWIIDPKVDPAKVYPDTYKCYWSVFDDKCGKSVNCSYDCQDAICNSCDTTAGSGADGKVSEYDDCTTRAIAATPKGACYDVAAKDATACFADTTFDTKPCDDDEYYYPSGTGGDANLEKLKDGVLIYFRGACRDNANWKNSSSTGGDAGPLDGAIEIGAGG